METNLTETRIRAMIAAGFWRDESLELYLDRWARERPAKTALVDGQGRYTWEALARAVDRVAHGLRAHGVEPGSVISCQLPNWNEAILIFLAALRLGAVVNPIPPTYRASEVRFMLGLLESQVAVVPVAFRGFSHAAMLVSLRPALPRLEHVFVARGEGPDSTLPLATLTDQAWEARADRRGLPGTDANAVHEVVFTSGTTGEPKGVMHTQNTTLSTIYRLIDRSPRVLLAGRGVDGLHARSPDRLSLRLLPDPAARRDRGLAGRLERRGGGAADRGRGRDVHHGGHAVPAGPDLHGSAARPALAPPVHLGGRAHPASAGARRPGAPGLRHLGGVGDDRERSGDLQRTAGRGGEGCWQRRGPAARHGAAGGG